MDKREAAEILFPSNGFPVSQVFTNVVRINAEFKSFASYTSDTISSELGLIKLVDGTSYTYELTDKGKEAYARWLLLTG